MSTNQPEDNPKQDNQASRSRFIKQLKQFIDIQKGDQIYD